MEVFAIINNVGIMIMQNCECKELIDNERKDKGFTWNPNNCECECDKLCDIGEYLDYKKFKCRKRLVDKLVEKCTENIDANKMVYNSTLNVIPLDEYGKIYNSCVVYIILLIIFFILSISISSVFIHFYWYLKRRCTETTIYWMQFYWQYKWEMLKEINIKSRTYYFYDDTINIKEFDSNLLKIDKTSYKNIDIYYIRYITIGDSGCVKINSVNPLYLIIYKVNR